jgi:hypothetical protein
MVVILMLLFSCSFVNPGLYSPSEKIQLTTSEALLTVSPSGEMRIILYKSKHVQVNSSLDNILKLIIKNTIDKRELELSPVKTSSIRKEGNTIQLSADFGGLPFEADFTISVKDDAFCFSGILKSSSDEWMVKEAVFPVLSAIMTKEDNIKIYWPFELGQCFDDPSNFGDRSFDYPSVGGTMPWFSVNSPQSGLYIGSHDPFQGGKRFHFVYDEKTHAFSADIMFPVNSEEFIIPDIILKPYIGSWYNASAFYRAWYDRNFKLAAVSDWARRSEGYMLTILKQQNGEVMYAYRDIDKLGDIAGKLNFSLVGLWGRGVGGHDRYYPNYMPDDLLGGRSDMKNAIERIHNRGFRVIVYTNGKIIDTSTDYYLFNGIETIILNQKKQPLLEFWKKHENSAPVIFATACPGSSLWRKTILDLAIDAVSLGADAFYIDQMGQGSPVNLMCYSEFHDHDIPQQAYSKYRIRLFHEIRTMGKKINPEFSIMTEGINDALLCDVDFFQGIPHLSTPFLFPEMFRYTFPEVIAVTLNADPGLHRYDANFSTVYGLRHEIMSRYPADAEYLQTGKLPDRNSYSNITGPPDIKRFTETSAEETSRYTHDLFKFENDNAEFLRSGRFIDEAGLQISGNSIMAKGFVNGNKIGVVVWNKHLSLKNDFSVTIPGYIQVKASEPGNDYVKGSSPLDPNTIRLIVFEKN